MRTAIIQHVSFEGPGSILNWAKNNGHTTSIITPDDDDPLPPVDDFDMLVIMGGPMNIYEEEKYPWLPEEKNFIKEAIFKDKKVLGICLGAQLIADVLGADIYKGTKEIGWFEIYKDKDNFSDILDEFPDVMPAFHWHGDTFNIPYGAKRLFSSEATLNQGFIFGDKVVGLQFHWEITPEGLKKLIKNSFADIDGSQYVQSEKEMFEKENFEVVNGLMDKVLNYLENVN